MRQYAKDMQRRKDNQRYRYLLQQGQTGLSVAFDLPIPRLVMMQMIPLALGEVGKVGVSISSVRDMETLFRDIPLDKVSTSDYQRTGSHFAGNVHCRCKTQVRLKVRLRRA